MPKDKALPSLFLLFLTTALIYYAGYVSAQPLPTVTIHGVTFQVAVCQGEQKTSPVFYVGEIACIKAIPPVGGATVDVQVDLIHPTAGRITPMARKTLALTSDTTLTDASYKIQPGDPEGDYIFRISVWKNGELREGTLTFTVQKKETTSWLTWLIIPILIAVAALGGYIYLTRRKEQQLQSQAVSGPTAVSSAITPSVGAVPEGTQVYGLQGKTIVVRTPTGETVTVAAKFVGPGGKIIPITSLPQTFGREDFRGIADESSLRVISRRHFTVSYDYHNGTFLIEDAGSTNGTLLNGEEIRGKGPVPLKDGDTVSPAGVLQLRFTTGAI